MRGEDVGDVREVARALGSPPHARGRLVRNLVYERVGRITPACAGKTQFDVRRPLPQTDHPRMRGEDTNRSSPGTLTPWITPACAGKTPSPNPRGAAFGDHPRMRGEDGPGNAYGVREAGSPPHARGRPDSTPNSNRPRWDHPRMRGEDRPDHHESA